MRINSLSLLRLALVLGVGSFLWEIALPSAEDVSAGPRRGYCLCVYPKGGAKDGCMDCPPGVNCASCTPSDCPCDAAGQ
jgi:hypothetical protein